MTRWEPPKAGNAAFWAKYADPLLEMVTIVHKRDPWFAWPWAGHDLIQPPGESLLWFDGSADGWRNCSEAEWPGMEVPLPTFSDHGPSTVIDTVSALAVAA